MLISLAAIVTGSEQLLLLPSEQRRDQCESFGSSRILSQQSLLKPVDRIDTELEEEEKSHLDDVLDRMRNKRSDSPKYLCLLALQAPIMLLTLAVVLFFAALLSIVFGPLVGNLVLDDNARVRRAPLTHGIILTDNKEIAIAFSVASLWAFFVFCSASLAMHKLFGLEDRNGKSDPAERTSTLT